MPKKKSVDDTNPIQPQDVTEEIVVPIPGNEELPPGNIDNPEEAEESKDLEISVDLSKIKPVTPKRFTVVSPDVTLFQIVLPNGIMLKLRGGDHYTSSDPEVIEFLSKRKGLQISNINDVEYKRFMAKQMEAIPTVYNTTIKQDDLNASFWSSLDEKKIIAELKSRGYDVIKK